MKENITAVYEDGILRPLTHVDFKDHQKLNLRILNKKSVVLETKGMVQGNSKHIKEISDSKEI